MFTKEDAIIVHSLCKWWRTYGTRARGGTYSPLCWHMHCCSSTEFAIRNVGGRGARLLPRLGQPPEITLLRQGEVVYVPLLNQEHSLTQHVTSEIFPFGNITASYNTFFGNTILVLDGKLVTMDLLCFYERRVE